jgi:hypothetical protein
MFTLSINHLLEVAEQQQPNSNPDQLLFITERGLFLGGDNQPVFRNLAQADRFHHPLTTEEERRLKALDRKAKGGLLTYIEDLEFEKLLEIKRLYGVSSKAPYTSALIRA